ncbi:regulation of retrograde dense core granule transport [Homalodisca vitripennis]|nr:regulation of retrograde dense core granule transport [Homalodisca vitripennis]
MSSKTVKLVPEGWKRKEIIRKKGISAGKVDVYIYSPKGRIFRSRKDLLKYFEENELQYKIDDFSFKANRQPSTENNSIETINSSVPCSGENPILDLTTKLCDKSIKHSSISDGEVFISEPTETSSDFEESQNLQEFSEYLRQIKYDKERAETSLQNLEKEAHESVMECEREIELLKAENLVLKREIKKNNEEISSLRNSLNPETIIVENNVEFPVISKKCNTVGTQITKLEHKINTLKKRKSPSYGKQFNPIHFQMENC